MWMDSVLIIMELPSSFDDNMSMSMSMSMSSISASLFVCWLLDA